MRGFSDGQRAVLRVSGLASELLEAVALLDAPDRNGLLRADVPSLSVTFTDEERNAVAMCTAAVAAHLRVNPRIHD
jgi:hypothetical protein